MEGRSGLPEDNVGPVQKVTEAVRNLPEPRTSVLTTVPCVPASSARPRPGAPSHLSAAKPGADMNSRSSRVKPTAHRPQTPWKSFQKDPSGARSFEASAQPEPLPVSFPHKRRPQPTSQALRGPQPSTGSSGLRAPEPPDTRPQARLGRQPAADHVGFIPRAQGWFNIRTSASFAT